MAVEDGFLHPDLEFIRSRVFRNGQLWEVKKKRAEEACRRCGKRSSVRYGKVVSLVRERSFAEKPLWLLVHKHRLYCKCCRKPFTEPTPGTYHRKRTTQRFQKWVKKEASDCKDLKTAQRRCRCSAGYVFKAFYEQAEVRLRTLRTKRWPLRLGIDEHFFSRSKGYTEFCTVFTDLSRNKLFEVAHSKNTKQLYEQLKNIPGREQVQIVCIDLSSGYRALVRKLFPNAELVADKFHVLRLLHPEIMKQGRAIHGHRQDLKNRKRLLASRHKLDYWVRFDIDNYLKAYPQLKEVYEFKERMFTLYRTKGIKRAYLGYLNIIEQLKTTSQKRLLSLARTLERWRDEILNYFKYRVTNGPTEAINARAKALQVRACGYKSFKNYRLALLNACAF